MRSARAAGLALAFAGCHRSAPRRDAAVDRPATVVSLSARDAGDVDSVNIDVTPVDVPRDVSAVARHTRGPWRRLAVLGYAQQDIVGRFEDAPDLDGDGTFDALVAVRYTRTTTCRAQDPARPCPGVTEALLEGGDGHGPVRIAWVARYATDALAEESPSDAALGVGAGRLLGFRDLYQSPLGPPAVRLVGVSFSEFGPGLMVRSTLDVNGATQDTVDVVDLVGGPGLDTLLGSMVHHCARVGDTAVRSGALAIDAQGNWPLVWRAASGHPFTGCPTEAASFDATVSEPLARAMTVTVQEDSVADPHAHAQLVLEGERVVLRTAPRVRRHRGRAQGPDAGVDPFTLGDLQFQEISRSCAEDRVRYTAAGRRCELRLTRDDGPLYACTSAASLAFDPAPPRAVALVPEPEGARLVFTRGGRAYSQSLSGECARGHRRVSPEAATGSFAPGLTVSPSGARVLFSNGFDVWLSDQRLGTLSLVNPPGGAIARGTVRALAFESDAVIAMVISTHFVKASVEANAAAEGPPRALTLDRETLARTAY